MKTKRHLTKVLVTAKQNPESPLRSPESPEEPAKKSHICEDCKMQFAYRRGLTRHSKSCLKMMLKNQDRIIKEQRQKLAEYKALLETTGKLAQTNAETAKTSMETVKTATKRSYSAINYLIKHHANAPVIKPLGHKEIRLLDMREEDLLKTLLYHYRKKTLQRFIGEFVITIYKEEDVKLQSVWVSYSNRLSYIVRQLLNDEPQWVVDKTGRILLKTVIRPFLEELRMYVNEEAVEPSQDDYPSRVDYYRAIKAYGDAVVMGRSFIESRLAQQIVKFIAPELILNRD